MDALAVAAAGFQSIDADGGLKDRALENLQRWLGEPEFAPYRTQLEWQIQTQQWAALLDQFYQVLPFGTGGRRGPVGIGPNRMNLWTLGASVQGHCEYLKEKFPGRERLSVVLAYDVRRFLDNRKVYHPALPNPVLGLSSKDFCHHAATVYVANGIQVHLLAPDSPRYYATPELSFVIRRLHAHGGLNVSASHNPPDDNGGKFYDERGAQPVPPDDQIMSDLVDLVTQIKSMVWNDALRTGKVHFLDDAHHKAFIDLVRRQSLIPPPKFDEIAVVFTPLHGVGSMTAMEALSAQGFRPIPVDEQMAPDGQFPNVTLSPNPEVPESLDRAERVAREHQADLVLATDPDADRLGGMAADGQGGFRILTGNEIASLITWFKLDQLHKQGRMPRSPVVITTLVTTSLVTRIARRYGSQIVNNLLVGFKNMAEVLRQLDDTGAYEDIQASPADMIIACEESHGVMTMPEIRDKDSACGCLLLAELALDEKRQGRTLVDRLRTIAQEFGYFRNELINLVMTGIEGRRDMGRMMDRLRSEPPREIGGRPVSGVEDLLDPNGRMGPIQGATDAAGRNVLMFRLGQSGSVVIRPSGTEPKAKAYIEFCTPPRSLGMSDQDWQQVCGDADRQTRSLAESFLNMALGLVGQKPTGQFRLSQ
jgi:phosphoglucomutase/phosphomannomutase